MKSGSDFECVGWPLCKEKGNAFQWRLAGGQNIRWEKIYELTNCLPRQKAIYILVSVGPRCADIFFVSATPWRQNVLRKKKDIAYILTSFQPPFKKALFFRSFWEEANKRNNKQLL